MSKTLNNMTPELIYKMYYNSKQEVKLALNINMVDYSSNASYLSLNTKLASHIKTVLKFNRYVKNKEASENKINTEALTTINNEEYFERQSFYNLLLQSQGQMLKDYLANYNILKSELGPYYNDLINAIELKYSMGIYIMYNTKYNTLNSSCPETVKIYHISDLIVETDKKYSAEDIAKIKTIIPYKHDIIFVEREGNSMFSFIGDKFRTADVIYKKEKVRVTKPNDN